MRLNPQLSALLAIRGAAINQTLRGRDLAASVRAIFANGEQGLWLDFWDTTKIFQDSSGTVRLTGAGDLYGYVADKSGRGNNATQATTGAKPAAALNAAGKLVAVYDGFDDFMATPAINFTGTDKVTVFVSYRQLANNGSITNGVLIESSTNSALVNGAFRIGARPSTANGGVVTLLRGDAVLSTGNTANLFNTPVVRVDSLDIAGTTAANEITTAVNGVDQTLSIISGTTAGAGSLGNYAVYIGMRGGNDLQFAGEISSIICVGRSCTAAEKAAVLAYQASNMGLAL